MSGFVSLRLCGRLTVGAAARGESSAERPREGANGCVCLSLEREAAAVDLGPCVRQCVWSHGGAMTRATLTKLLILVILVFIICLPEFFILSRGGSLERSQLQVHPACFWLWHYVQHEYRSLNCHALLFLRNSNETQINHWIHSITFNSIRDQEAILQYSAALRMFCFMRAFCCGLRLTAHVCPLWFCFLCLQQSDKNWRQELLFQDLLLIWTLCLTPREQKKITLFLSFVLVSKVNFLCLPYPSCQRGDAVAGENGGRGGSETKGKHECSSWQTAEWQKRKEVCTQENQVSLNPVSDSRVWGDSDKNWFTCETDLDMAELQQNLSSSGSTVKTLPTFTYSDADIEQMVEEFL